VRHVNVASLVLTIAVAIAVRAVHAVMKSLAM
jgi:hypothetical protein